MDNNNAAGDYKMPPCQAGLYPTAETSMKNTAPTIGDIASYNYMNPIPQQLAGSAVPQMGTQQIMGAMPQLAGQQSTMGIMRQSGEVMPQAGGQQATTSGTMIQTGMPPSVVTPESLQYLNGFLRTQIGRPVLVTFLVGTNTLTDRTGTLLSVGINYILIREERTDDILACDFYNIKFIRFYY